MAADRTDAATKPDFAPGDDERMLDRLLEAADEILTAMRDGNLTPDEAYQAWQAERARIKEAS